MATSRFGRLVVLATSIALFAALASCSSDLALQHSRHHAKHRAHVRLAGSSHTPPDNSTSPSSSSSVSSPPASPPAITTLMNIKQHTNGNRDHEDEDELPDKSPQEIEAARVKSLKNSPKKAEPDAFPSKGAEADEWLKWHNMKRKQHGIPALKWDPALAKLAAKWLPQLRSECDLKHSPTTKEWRGEVKGKGGKYSQAGENLYAYYGSGPTTIARACQSWIDEEQCYKYGPLLAEGTTYKGVNCNMKKAQSGHYTQFMSDTATHLGCAWYYCGKKQFLTSKKVPSWVTNFGYIYNCEYGNAKGGFAGNSIGSYPFSSKIAREIGLPFLKDQNPQAPPIDNITGTSKAGRGGGIQLSAEASKYFKVVKNPDGSEKVVAKTPAELAAGMMLSSLQSEKHQLRGEDISQRDDKDDDDTHSNTSLLLALQNGHDSNALLYMNDDFEDNGYPDFVNSTSSNSGGTNDGDDNRGNALVDTTDDIEDNDYPDFFNSTSSNNGGGTNDGDDNKGNGESLVLMTT